MKPRPQFRPVTRGLRPVRDPSDDVWTGALRMVFAPGEEIYAQEEAPDPIYRVVTGAVRTSHLLMDGRRQIGDFYYEGDVFGVETADLHRFSAEALTNCQIAVVRRSGSAAFDSGKVDRLLWSATATELARTQGHMLLLTRTTACERVARFLIEIADRFRGESVTLPMSRQDMADYLGLTIETVSRTMSRFRRLGLIDLVGRHDVALREVARLQAMAEGMETETAHAPPVERRGRDDAWLQA